MYSLLVYSNVFDYVVFSVFLIYLFWIVFKEKNLIAYIMNYKITGNTFFVIAGVESINKEKLMSNVWLH